MQGPNGYWTRFSRRAALRGAAAAGVGAAALTLAGCGGGSSSSKQSPASTSSATVTDSTKGKPGGALKWGASSAPSAGTFDPVTQPATAATNLGMSYSGLLAMKWGQESVDLFDFFNLEPDLAQAMPEQPDETTLVVKLRPGIKFHNGAPLVAEDVAYSYDRYRTHDRSPYRQRYQTWLDRVETPDAQTVVIKLKFPYADALVALAGNVDGYIMSKAYEEGPEVGNKMMGTGPYVWSDFVSGSYIKWKKNPDYHIKPYPYFDEVWALGYADPIKRMTDFVSNQISLPWLVYAEERDQIKQQRPEARLQGWDSWAQALFMRTDKPPFNDKRVRQAFSMAIDRKKIREVATKGEGRVDQFFPLMYKSLFGFREVSELGDAKKYWDYNPAEAKKLIAAAGYDKPIETQLSHYQAVIIGQFFVDIAVASEAQWREIGIANVKDNEQLAAQYSSTTQIGQYEGMGLGITTSFNGGAPAFTLNLKDLFYWGPNGEHSVLNLNYTNNPQLNPLLEKQIRQLKLEDRKATYREMEPIMAEEQYRIVYSTTTQNYFFDPNLRNARMPVEQGSRRFVMRWWNDKS